MPASKIFESPTLLLPKNSINKNESLFLDIVRLLSAQMVLFGHLASFLTGGTALIGGRYHIQDLGVVLFFILSGYLICTTIPRYINFKQFFIDRFARIYVTLVPCLFLIFAMDCLTRQSGHYIYESAFNLKTFLGNLFMLQDHPALVAIQRLAGLSHPLLTSFGSARPLWTLAVEWWLYMFVGWVLLAQRRNLLILLAFAVVPVAHATLARGQGLTLIWLLGASFVFLPSLKIELGKFTTLLSILVFLFLARFSKSQDFYDFQGALFLAGAFSLLLLWSRGSQRLVQFPDFLVKIIRTLAGASYALYLLHYTVIEMTRTLELSRFEVAVISVGLSNILSIVVYQLFDRHHKKIGYVINRYVDRYFGPKVGCV